MDNQKPDVGSFGAVLGQGAGSALAQAMQRRGLNGSVLNQNTTSPSAVPVPATGPVQGIPIPQQAPSTPPMGEMMGGQAQPTTQGMSQGSPEAQIIIKTLGSRLGSISKQEEAQLGIQ